MHKPKEFGPIEPHGVLTATQRAHQTLFTRSEGEFIDMANHTLKRGNRPRLNPAERYRAC